MAENNRIDDGAEYCKRTNIDKAMQKVLNLIKANKDGITQDNLLEKMEPMNRKTLILAIQCLITDGYIEKDRIKNDKGVMVPFYKVKKT